MFDVAVVGGGPAGSAAAIALARQGHHVVLLDRAGFPRRKACGEGLFPAGVRALERLGVRLPQGGAAGVEGVRFHAGQASAEARFGTRPALGVQRSLLDAALLERARAAGVEVREGLAGRGLEVRGPRVAGVRTDAGLVEARFLVAADGLHSRLRRLAGLEGRRPGGRYGITAHLQVAGEAAPWIEIFFERGYELYLTPVASGIMNAAVLTRRAGMKTFAGDVAGGWRKLVEGHRALAPAVSLLDVPLAAGPFPRGCSRAWRGNFALVGDAAGFFDGISGEGMTAALLGAEACAEAVSHWLDDGDPGHLRGYERRRRALVRNAESLARLALGLARWPWLAERAVANLGRQPGTFARLLAVNAGESGLASLRPRDLLALSTGR